MNRGVTILNLRVKLHNQPFRGHLLAKFLQHGTTMNAQAYEETYEETFQKLRRAIKSKRWNAVKQRHPSS